MTEIMKLPFMKNALALLGIGCSGLIWTLLLVAFGGLQMGEAEWSFAGGTIAQMIGQATAVAQMYLAGGPVRLPTMTNAIVTNLMNLLILGGVLSLQASGKVDFTGPAWGLISAVSGGVSSVGGTAIQFYLQGPVVPKE